jgi:hypothetical protein
MDGQRNLATVRETVRRTRKRPGGPRRPSRDDRGRAAARAPRQARSFAPKEDVTALAHRVAAERSVLRAPRQWIDDDFIAGTALSILGTVGAALITALMYFSAI